MLHKSFSKIWQIYWEHAGRARMPKGRSGSRSGSGSPLWLAPRRKSRFPQLSPAIRGGPTFTRTIVRGAPTLRLWMSGTRGTQLHALRPGHVRVREVALKPERERETGWNCASTRDYRRSCYIVSSSVSCRFPPTSRVQFHRFTLVIMRYQSDDITRTEYEAAWHGWLCSLAKWLISDTLILYTWIRLVNIVTTDSKQRK